MAKVKPIADCVNDAAAHKLFYGRGGFRLGEVRRVLDERVREISADRRRHLHDVAGGIAETIETPPDPILDTRREPRSGHARRLGVLLELAYGLHDDEGIPTAHRPDLCGDAL